MIRIRQIKVLVDNNVDENIKKKCATRLKVDIKDIKEYKIVKESIDSRDKPILYYVYEVDVSINNEDKILSRIKDKDIFKTPKEEYIFNVTGKEEVKGNIIIVGSGPAGLFTAYMLATKGFKPIIIERGKDIDSRVSDVTNFWDTGKLNEESNVLFGEGGAGTFSDGKLNTTVKNTNFRIKKVLEIFVENGALEEILYVNKPHIGTDLLRDVVKNMRKKIIDMGGSIRFNTKLTNINITNNHIDSIIVNDNEKIDCKILVLAIGHSAFDTFQMLYNHQIKMEAKPFAVGVRIMHPATMINKAQYGVENHPLLGAASYKLTHTATNGRGVYSFCMCPGGYVVNSSSLRNRLSINGMSNHKRDTIDSNVAIIVTVFPKDYGQHPLSGIEYQKRLEENAYIEGKGFIPIQLYKDFKDKKITTSLGKIKPILKGAYTLANLNNIFPSYISQSLIEGIEAFGKKIEGFNRDDAILAGVESRTSSPVRIIRDEEFETNIKGIYPIGEGAGYAGGITSSAIDGIKASEAIMKKYKK